MKTGATVFLAILLSVIVIGANVSISIAQTVNVKMICNTSTCLDTLKPSHFVKILGSSAKGTTPAMTWTVADGITMTNTGGDYWEGTFQAVVGDTITFKFWTGTDSVTGTFHWGGWEGPLDAGESGDNRKLYVGSADTTLPLQYFNGWETKLAQYWNPFASKTDSVAVYFRVNMGGATFDPATQVVDVRGGLPMGGDPTWTTIVTLTRETNSVNSGSFWSGVAYVPKASVTPGVTTQSWKFVIQPEVWESVGNRSFTFASTNDTTILWYYFNDRPPSGPKVDATVLFLAKLDALENAGLFNRALGDKIAVTGAKGWPASTFDFDTEPTMLKMTYDPTAKEWSLAEAFSMFPGENITYKYYIQWDSSRVDTASPNYIIGLTMTDGWEEPGSTGGADRKYTYTSDASQFVPGDFGADQQFFNSLHWKGVIKQPIQVTFTVNMAPAASATTNPGTLFRPGIDTVYVQFDGCMVSITQGKTMWGTDNRLMLTDIDGDGKYTGTYDLAAPTFPQFCYRIVYTSLSGEIWNGSGSAIVGRRYYQYVHPTSVFADSAQWPGTYALTEVDWKLDNLTIEDPPDLNTVTGVNDGGAVPVSFELQQNYPNPFNPTTMISYQLPVASDVRLVVFDMLGREVSELVNERKDAGIHGVSFNGAGLSSGVYFYRLRAGSFVQAQRMLLVK